MTANLDPRYKSWRTHLTGLLALLQQQPKREQQQHNPLTPLTYALHQPATSLLLPYTTLLHFYYLSESLPTPQARTLDIRKFRVALKRTHRDFLLLLSQPPSRRLSHRYSYLITTATLVLSSVLLLTTGALLSRTYATTREYAKLNMYIESGVDATYMTVRHAASAISAADAVGWMWCLYTAAICAPSDSRVEQSSIRELLWHVGREAKVPKAMALVCELCSFRLA
jgi:hypothetical protein